MACFLGRYINYCELLVLLLGRIVVSVCLLIVVSLVDFLYVILFLFLCINLPDVLILLPQVQST